MLIRINDNQGPAVVQRSQLEHWGKTLPAPSVEQSRRLFRKEWGEHGSVQNAQRKQKTDKLPEENLMRGEAPADKKEGCPGGSFEKRDRKRNWRV